MDDRKLGNGNLDSGTLKFQRFGFTTPYAPVDDSPRQAMNSYPDGLTGGENKNRVKQESNNGLGPSNLNQDSTSGNISRKNVKNGHAEGHIQGESQRQRINKSSEPQDNSNSSREDSKDRDIHVNDDHAVYDHVFRNREDCRGYRGETKSDGVAEGSLPVWNTMKVDQQTNDGASNQHLAKQNATGRQPPNVVGPIAYENKEELDEKFKNAPLGSVSW